MLPKVTNKMSSGELGIADALIFLGIVVTIVFPISTMTRKFPPQKPEPEGDGDGDDIISG